MERGFSGKINRAFLRFFRFSLFLEGIQGFYRHIPRQIQKERVYRITLRDFNNLSKNRLVNKAIGSIILYVNGVFYDYNAKNSLLLQLLKLFGAYIVSQLLIVFIFAAAVSGDEIPEKYDLPMVIIAILLAFAVNMVIDFNAIARLKSTIAKIKIGYSGGNRNRRRPYRQGGARCR